MPTTETRLPPGVRSIGLWSPGRLGVDGGWDVAAGPDAIAWLDLDASPEMADVLTGSLRSHCPGLTAGMLEDLLSPDDEPAGTSYEGSAVCLASSCWVQARPRSENARRGSAEDVGGALVIGPVEILSGPGWLLTCWHPARVFVGPREVDEVPPDDPEELLECLGRRWMGGVGTSSGDLGTLLLYELVLSYGDAYRALDGWLEDWELAYHLDDELAVQHLIQHRERLAELWGSMAVLRDWIKPQNRSGLSEDIGKAWLPAQDRELVESVDDRIDRVLGNLRELAENLRSSFSVLHVQQLEEQRERREQMMRRVELAAAAFLIPTLVVGFYGANTWVPGQGAHWGFWVMLVVLLVASAAGLLAVRLWQKRDKRDDEVEALAKAKVESPVVASARDGADGPSP